MNETLLLILRIVGAILTIGFVVIRTGFAVVGFRAKRRAATLSKALIESDTAPQFTKPDIDEAVQGYIRPECSIIDPANSNDQAVFSDVRQDIFSVIDNSITFATSKQFQLILADSGMGKTSFCLNYYLHYKKKTKSDNIVLISLATIDAIDRIKAVTQKSMKVAVLDALDEDPSAIKNGNDRLYNLLELCADFKAVIITCRSQFFANDLAIPSETGVSMVVPRRAGQNSTYTLSRLYLTPFNTKQISAYLNRHFPFWYVIKIHHRIRAQKLVSSVQELSTRPMLLELLPELVKTKADAQELFDLYSFMVNRWLEREANWIEPAKLLNVSKRLAVYIYNQHVIGGGDRVSLMELNSIANDISENDSQWAHLTTRSLVNRDSKGLFKFAHRSIMEYLFVLAAIDGVEECLSCRWTDFMKQLFISWGYTESGAANLLAAERIIRSGTGATGLLPLSEAPSSPTSAPDFAIAAGHKAGKSGIRRQATPLWRINNFVVRQSGYSVSINDFEFYKHWLLVDFEHLSRDGLASTYTDTIANIQTGLMNDDTYRAPSYAEFVTLVAGLSAIGRMELLPENVFFYLGDKMGERRHLLATCSNNNKLVEYRPLIVRDKPRLVPSTGQYITVYEIGVFVGIASLSMVRGVALRISNGFNWQDR